MTTNKTTIQVDLRVWQFLNRMRRPGESFNDVLMRALALGDEDPAILLIDRRTKERLTALKEKVEARSYDDLINILAERGGEVKVECEEAD